MKHRPAIVTGALFAGLCAFAFSQNVFAQANAGWVTLLDGTNMNNFNKVGDANWRIVDGAVQADKGMGGFLVTKNSYANFQIRMVPFSNRGWWLDACTEGVKVDSSFFDWGPFGGWAQWSGTSFAAARVSGALAAMSGKAGGPAAAVYALTAAPGLRRVANLGAFVPAHVVT